MMNKKVLLKHFVISFLVLLLVFAIHIYILFSLDVDLYQNKIIEAYVINYIIATFIFIFLFKLRKKYKDNLGYLFMFGSFIKFILFFVLFYPAYKLDGTITKPEFFTFFIPYIICLIIETLTISKLLKYVDLEGAKKTKE